MGEWALVVALIFALSVSIADLRREHSDEIYAIWYAFSLSLIVFVVLHLLAARSGVDITLALGPQHESSLKAAYRYFTDIDDEVVLVVAFVTLSIGPQLLAYILSSFSGSARAPRYVRTVTKIAVLSLVKFLAVWGSILISGVVAQLFLGKPMISVLFIQGFSLVVAAFILADAEHKYLDQEFTIRVVPGCVAILNVPPIRQLFSTIHRVSTRHNYGAAGKLGNVRAPDWEWKLGGRTCSISLRGPVARLIYSSGRRWFPGHPVFDGRTLLNDRENEGGKQPGSSDRLV